jgi:Holliday junction resolvase RusA-like endonuclease
MIQKSIKVLISLIVILGVLVIALGFFILTKRSDSRQTAEIIQTSNKGADALSRVQGYVVSEGEFNGMTVDEVIMSVYSSEEYRHIGWYALEENDGSVIAGYTVEKEGESIPHLFYVADDTIYTLNNPAIRLFGQNIRYYGSDSQTLISDYINSILEKNNSGKDMTTYIKQKTFLFTSKEISKNMTQYLSDKDLLDEMMKEGKILVLEKDMEVEVLQVDQFGGWSEVRVPYFGITGYVSSEFLDERLAKVRVSPDSLSSGFYSTDQAENKTAEVSIPDIADDNDILMTTGNPFDVVVDFIAAQMKMDKKAMQDLLIDNEFKKAYLEEDYSGDALIMGFKIIDIDIDGNMSTAEVEEELMGYDGISVKKTAIIRLVNDDRWLIESYELR